MTQTTANRSINIVTEVPGPKAKELAKRSANALPDALSIVHPIFVEKTEGALVTDIDGNSYVDWIGGVGVMNVGHSNPKVIEAIHNQVDKYTHTDYTIVSYEPYIELCEKLNAITPVRGEARTALFNTGAEAVENAIKIARFATGRSGVICFTGAFHGRSLMAMTLTSKVNPYKKGFGPFAPEVYRAPFANPADHNGDAKLAATKALEDLRKMFDNVVDPESVAAIIVEPIQGEGGFVVPDKSFLEGLREIADEIGAVLIFDEVQTGMGRAGYYWVSEYFGVEPDLVTSAKSIAAGIPLSAVIGTKEIMNKVPDSGIGGTYPGNPVACAAAIAVIDLLREELLQQGKELGEKLKAKFDEYAATDAGITDSRGIGPMRAIEFTDPATGRPDGERTSKIVEYSAQNGLLLHKAGMAGNCIRVLVPLNITDEQLEDSFRVLSDAISKTA